MANSTRADFPRCAAGERRTAAGCLADTGIWDWRRQSRSPATPIFLKLSAGLDRQRAAETFARYGLAAPPITSSADNLAGLGDAWKETPLTWARAYLQLVNEQQSPAQNRIVKGMLDSAERGTARAVDAALGRNAALGKTGTAACSHTPRGAADGFTVILYPAAQPRLLLLVRVHGVTGAESAKIAGAMMRSLGGGER